MLDSPHPHPHPHPLNYDDNSISILLGYGDGTFQNQTIITVGLNPVYVGVGDFNNDSKPDLVVANNEDNTITILLNLSS
jgi:hypothetical protein